MWDVEGREKYVYLHTKSDIENKSGMDWAFECAVVHAELHDGT